MWKADKTCSFGKPSDFILLTVSHKSVSSSSVPRTQSTMDASISLSFWTYEADDQICDHVNPFVHCPRQAWVAT